MQNQKTNFAKKALVAGTIVAGTFFSAAAMANTSSAFSFRTLGSGNDVRNELNGARSMNLDLACAAKKDSGTGKAKDAKCGAKKDSTMSKTKDGKCGEGKCGGKKKDAKKPSGN